MFLTHLNLHLFWGLSNQILTIQITEFKVSKSFMLFVLTFSQKFKLHNNKTHNISNIKPSSMIKHCNS